MLLDKYLTFSDIYPQVVSSSTASEVTISGGNATSNGANIALRGSTHGTASSVRFRAGTTETLSIDSAGLVTVNGGDLKLKAPAGNQTDAELLFESPNNSSFGSTFVIDSKILSTANQTDNAYGSRLKFFTNNNSNALTERMSIDSAGTVLIGDDTDAYANIGRARVGYNGDDSDYASFSHRDKASGTSYALMQSAAGATFLNSASGQQILFRVNNSTQMSISSAGNMGLGISPDANAKLDVNGTIYVRNTSVKGVISNPSSDIFDIANASGGTSNPITFSTQGTERLRIDSAGLATFANGITVSGGFTTLGGFNDLTIASGAVTATSSTHNIDTEGGGATDYLDTINGGSTGSIITLMAASGSRTVVVEDGTNLKLAGDCTLDNAEDTITLIKSGSAWHEVSRSNNGA